MGLPVPRRCCLPSARTARWPILPLLALLLTAGSAPAASAAAPTLFVPTSFTGAEDALFSMVPTVEVTTLAGSGTSGGVLDGTGTAAQFSNPAGLAVDAAGTVYVADYNNRRVRKITSVGVVTTLADGTGTAVDFSYPAGVAVDAAGTVYVADMYSQRIRKITSAGVVTTLAGGTAGGADGTGTAAQFYYPSGVAVDAAGNVYVAEHYNYRVRKITPAGVVTTLAGSTAGFADGTGTAAQFNQLFSVAVDVAGYVYVADWNNHRIRKISPAGVVTTLAGSTEGFADGSGTAALFSSPPSVAVDAAGNVYVGDGSNPRIRKITPVGVTVGDADGGTLTVALGVSNGTLTATLTGGATVSAGELASGSVTLSGTSTQLNAALLTLSYQGTINYNGADTLTVTVSDGVTPVTATGSITLTAVNDAPTLVVSSAMNATGGTEATVGIYKTHTFTTSGTFTPTGSGAVEVLLVGGGGGGGPTLGGGGGGGGVITMPVATTVGGVGYAVVVGAGGASGTNGQASTIFGATAAGGGTSGGFDTDAASAGGSGGGAAANGTVLYQGGASAGNSLGANTGTIYGNRGGHMTTARSNSPTRAAGGGGAGGGRAGYQFEYHG